MGKKNITDFGEKIGGARKDFYFSEPKETKPDGVLLYKKDVWPKPDFSALVNIEGKDKTVCFWQSRMYDAITPKLLKDECRNDEDLVAAYKDSVLALKECVMGVETFEDVKNFYKNVFKPEGFVVSTYGRYVRIPEKHSYSVNNALLKNAQVSSPKQLTSLKAYAGFALPKGISRDYSARKNQLKAILVTDRVRFGYRNVNRCSVYVNGEYYTFYRENNGPDEVKSFFKPDTFFIADTYAKEVLVSNIVEPYVDAEIDRLCRKYCEEKKKEKEKKIAAKPVKAHFAYPQVSFAERRGPEILGWRKATGDMFLGDFKFKGGEFGLWLSDGERQEHLDKAYEAFADLADVLGISRDRIAFGGSLSIAFGARGHGGKNPASAHYEPGRVVINLTKMRGAGCLAHEWGHALDHYLSYSMDGTKTGVLLSDPVNKGCWKNIKAFPELLSSMMVQDGKETDFHKGSVRFDMSYYSEGNGYWSSTAEMFARALDCYVADKCKVAGIRDDYLTAYSDSFRAEINGAVYCAYPVGREREIINRNFDALFAELKEKKIL